MHIHHKKKDLRVIQETFSTSVNITSMATDIRKTSLCPSVTQLCFMQLLGTDVPHF